MPETSSAVADPPEAPEATGNPPAAPAAEPNAQAETEKRKSVGLSRIGAALAAFNEGEAKRTGRLPDDAAPEAEEGDEPPEAEGEEAETQATPQSQADDQAAQVTPKMIAAATRLGISERALRAMPADVRAEVLEAERRTTATISGLRGNLKQASDRSARAGQNLESPQGAEDEGAGDEGDDSQRSGRGEERDPETSETRSRPRTQATLPSKIDAKAFREKLVLQFGEEQAETLMEVVNPLSQYIESQHQQAESDHKADLEDKATKLDKFLNSSNMPDVFGVSYEKATKEQRENRKQFAVKAFKGLNAGIHDDWPAALRKTLRAEYDRSESKSAEERVRGNVIRRSQSVTPSPSRNAGGHPQGGPGSGKRSGLDAIQGVLNRIHLGEDD